MKNKFLAIILAVASLSLVACEDYLNEMPQDQFTDDNYWTSATSLETYGNLFYDNFSAYGSGWSKGQYHNFSMCDDYNSEDFSIPTVNIPTSSSAWSSPYVEIRRANIMINRIAKIENLAADDAAHWEGFARFFRAMMHFNLVQTYGDVPWVDTEIDIDNNEAMSQPRNDRAEVMKNVCADLQFAGENMRHTSNNTINDMCAWALLSRAALYEAAWQKYQEGNGDAAKEFYTIAKNAADKVISSGHYSISEFNLNAAGTEEYPIGNYKANYVSKSLAGNPEMILYKVYEYGTVKLAHAMQGWSCSSSKTWGMTKSAMESFVMSDGLPFYQSELGYDDTTVEGIFANRDARLAQIVSPTVIAPSGLNYEEGINSTTGYWTNKFVDWNDYGKGTWNAPYNDTDAPIYTYAEVLLNYAEACAELGTITNADLDKSINILRKKHGNIPALTVNGKEEVAVNGVTIEKDPANIFGVSNLLWELRRERRNELMCDGFRKADIYRWKMGKLLDNSINPDGCIGASKDVIVAFYEANKTDNLYKEVNLETVLADLYWYTAADGKVYTRSLSPEYSRTFDETKNYLEPVPSGQIQLNPNLAPNNPGWE